jgi:hypothetical protein
MRLTQPELQALTGRKRHTAQARWFADNFAVKVPVDDQGPIISKDGVDQLLGMTIGSAAKMATEIVAARTPTVREVNR